MGHPEGNVAWTPCDLITGDCPVYGEHHYNNQREIYFDHLIAADIFIRWRVERRPDSVFIYRVVEV